MAMLVNTQTALTGAAGFPTQSAPFAGFQPQQPSFGIGNPFEIVAYIQAALSSLVQLQQTWQNLLGPFGQQAQPQALGAFAPQQQLFAPQQQFYSPQQFAPPRQQFYSPQQFAAPPQQFQAPVYQAPQYQPLPYQSAQKPTAAPGQGFAKTDVAGLQRYIDAVNQNGGVNQAKLGTKEVGVEAARTSIVNGYAAEIYAGGRLEDANLMKQYEDQLHADLASSDPNARNGATFALVASRFKNAGGNYNNAQIDKILKATGNTDLANKGGVGQKDVQTLAAVTEAIKRGTLSLGELYDSTTGKDMLGGRSIQAADKAKYDRAIDVIVNKQDLGSSIQNAPKAGAAGNAGNSGNARAGNAGNSGNAKAGNAGNAGNANRASAALRFAATQFATR